MMGKVLALAPEEFVRALARQSSVWRRSSGFAGKRHRRNLRRRWIRLYKSRRGIQSLAQYIRPDVGILASDIEVSPESSLILLLPDNRYLDEQSDEVISDVDRKAILHEGASVNSRRELRRLIYSATASRSQTTLDLINASHTYRQALPSVARIKHGKRLALRGIYLEALGVAILPRLEQPMIEILQKQGAEVLTNSEILVSAPDIARLETPPDFWHRRILPNAGAEPQPYRGKGVSIGILDTGIDPDHPEFAHKDIVYSEFDETGEMVEGARKRDFGTHGTHVAGICVGRTAGIAPDAHLSVAAALTGTKNGQLRGSFAQTLGALNWLILAAGPDANGVQIINASLGTPQMNRRDIKTLHEKINDASKLGVVVVAAIGNNGHLGAGNHSFPARLDNVIGVGAIDRNDRVAIFSDWGRSYGEAGRQGRRKPDLVAPGVDIHSALAGGGYASMNGSSMSTPCVSSALALILEGARGRKSTAPQHLYDALMTLTRYSDNRGDNDPRVGRGCVHLDGLIPGP